MKLVNQGIFIINKIRFFKKDLVSKEKLYIIAGNKGCEAKCTFFTSNAVSDSVKGVQPEGGDFSYLENVSEGVALALVKFSSPLWIQKDAIVLGNRLDSDASQKENRIAFWGKLVSEEVDKYKITRIKEKRGKVLRMADPNTAVVVDLFKNNTVADEFMGSEVSINGIKGTVFSKFGKTGKVKVSLEDPIEGEATNMEVVLKFVKEVKKV